MLPVSGILHFLCMAKLCTIHPKVGTQALLDTEASPSSDAHLSHRRVRTAAHPVRCSAGALRLPSNHAHAGQAEARLLGQALAQEGCSVYPVPRSSVHGHQFNSLGRVGEATRGATTATAGRGRLPGDLGRGPEGQRTCMRQSFLCPERGPREAGQGRTSDHTLAGSSPP